MVRCEDRGDDERADERAGLVECLVHGERATAAEVDAGLGEHGVAGRGADGFAEPLADDEHAGQPQRPGDRDQRYRDHCDRVAGDRDRPVPSGSVGQPAGEQPEHQGDRLPDAGDDADKSGRRAEGGEVGTDDAAGAFVDEVAEAADEAEDEDEPQW